MNGYKFLLIILIIFFMPVISIAAVISNKVYAVSQKTYTPEELKSGKNITVISISDYGAENGENIENGSLMELRIKEYIEPQRGNRNGYLKVVLINHSVPSEGNKIKNDENFNIEGTLRLSTKKDKKEIIESAGSAVVGHILKVPGFSQAVAVSKGLIKPNPDQNRLQSAGTNLYKSTPLKYVEKGTDMTIEEDAVVVIRLKN